MKTKLLLQKLNCCCWSEMKNIFPIAFVILLFSFAFQIEPVSASGCNPITNGGTISGNESSCSGYNPSCITNVTYPCGGNGSIDYRWLVSTDNFATSSTISGAHGSTYDPGSITQTTWYKRLSKRHGCSSYNACSNIVMKRVHTPPTACITSQSSLCPGGSVQLCASSGNYQYQWSTGATTQCINVTTAGNYCVTITDCNGCTGTATRNVTVSSALSCSISGNCNLCQGQSTTLCAPSGCSSYLWNTGATTRCISVNSSGTYSVTVTNNTGCSSTCSRTVTVSSSVTCSISGNTSICQGGSTTLTAAPNCASYLWNTGATTQCITVNCAGTYTVTVTNNNGCSSSCSICVTTGTPPSCSISGNCNLCQGQSTTLCAPSGCSSYLWNTGATTRCISVNCSGTYSVTVTNNSGCSSTCSRTVTVSSSVTCSISGNTSICQGGSTTLTAAPNCASYLWNTGATTQCITVNCAGTYSVTVSNSGGCSSTCNVCVTVSAPPSSNISGNTHINFGGCTTLCAPSGCSSYSWSTGATTRCITVSSAGTYSVTVTNAAGCSSTSNVCVTVGCTVNVTICGNTSICPGQSTTLCATPSGCASYQWSNGATTRCISVNCAGTYTVCVVTGNGCTGNASVCVTVSGNGNGSSNDDDDDDEDDDEGRMMMPSGTDATTPAGISATTYPNPFVSTSTIEFTNAATSGGTVEIYSLDGRKIAELFNGVVEAGKLYQVKWTPADVPDGTYVYRIVCGENIKTGKLLLMQE